MKELVMKGLDRLLSATGVLALCTMIVCIAANVFSRFLFQSSLNWAEEYGYLFFCYTVFLGAAVCYGKKELISINVFVLMMPKFIQEALYYIKHVFLLLANIYMLYLSLEFTKNAASKLTSLMKISYSYMDASIVILFFAVTLYSFRDLFRVLLRKDVVEQVRKTE